MSARSRYKSEVPEDAATGAPQLKNNRTAARAQLPTRICATMRKKDETIVEIGKGLRREADDLTREPLPRRWIDLIRHLNEKERKQKEEENQQRS